MAIVLKESKVTISSSGTAVKLTSGTPTLDTTKVAAAIVTAGENNSGIVYVGSSAVDQASALGQAAASSESVILEPPQQYGVEELLDIDKIYVDSTASGDVVVVTVYVREG